MEYKPRKCCICGDPKSEIRDGHEIILRCRCDWKRGFQERLCRTLHRTFFKTSLMDWNPPLFQKPCNFHTLIRAQRIAALLLLYDFSHKRFGDKFAIHRSIELGKNLFIRGPMNSGRGLLVSPIKYIAATKNLSVTPLPGDFDVFRSEVAQSEAFGPSGDAMRNIVRGNYVDVDIMSLENIRQEAQSRITGDKTKKVWSEVRRFKGANVVDDIIARRRVKSGSMVLTSHDFAGEIGETLGDNMADALNSPNTSMILLFSPAEAESLGIALENRKKTLKEAVKLIGSKVKDEKTLDDNLLLKKNLEYFADALYFDEAFGDVNVNATSGGNKPTKEAFKAEGEGKLHPEAVKILAAFRVSKEAKDANYQEKIRQAYVEAARGASCLGMTEKELAVAGRLMGLATKKELLDSMAEKAKACRQEML